MKTPEESPLDAAELEDYYLANEVDRGDTIRFYLELVPIALLVLALVLKHFEQDYWLELMVVGGLLSAFIYLFFSWFMFKVKEYHRLELILSVVSGMIFPVGILGLIGQLKGWELANDLIDNGLYAALGLCFFSIALFLFNLQDERASKFYRNLLARLLIFSGMLLQLSNNL